MRLWGGELSVAGINTLFFNLDTFTTGDGTKVYNLDCYNAMLCSAGFDVNADWKERCDMYNAYFFPAASTQLTAAQAYTVTQMAVWLYLSGEGYALNAPFLPLQMYTAIELFPYAGNVLYQQLLDDATKQPNTPLIQVDGVPANGQLSFIKQGNLWVSSPLTIQNKASDTVTLRSPTGKQRFCAQGQSPTEATAQYNLQPGAPFLVVMDDYAPNTPYSFSFETEDPLLTVIHPVEMEPTASVFEPLSFTDMVGLSFPKTQRDVSYTMYSASLYTLTVSLRAKGGKADPGPYTFKITLTEPNQNPIHDTFTLNLGDTYPVDNLAAGTQWLVEEVGRKTLRPMLSGIISANATNEAPFVVMGTAGVVPTGDKMPLQALLLLRLTSLLGLGWFGYKRFVLVNIDE